MSIEELRERLLIILNRTLGDEEDDHIEADQLLLQYIDDREVNDTFNKIKKWYS